MGLEVVFLLICTEKEQWVRRRGGRGNVLGVKGTSEGWFAKELYDVSCCDVVR